MSQYMWRNVLIHKKYGANLRFGGKMSIVIVLAIAVAAAIVGYFVAESTGRFDDASIPAIGIFFIVFVLGVCLCLEINQAEVVSVEECVASVNYAEVRTTRKGTEYLVSCNIDGVQKKLTVSSDEYAVAANSSKVLVKISEIDNSAIPDQTVYNLFPVE